MCPKSVENDNNNVHIVNELLSENSNIKIIYMTPEKLLKSSFIIKNVIKSHNKGILRRIIINECHCIISWGYTFRPVYIDYKI